MAWTVAATWTEATSYDNLHLLKEQEVAKRWRGHAPQDAPGWNHRAIMVVTTHNRVGYVDTFARAIALDPAIQGGEVDLLVRDDASTEYGEQELKAWFPQATLIMEHRRGKSDQTIRKNFEWFKAHPKYTLMFSIDSDSVLDPSWWSFVKTHMPDTGFMTLYHSNAKHHKTHHCNDGVWCHQSSSGSLGMVVSNTLVSKILADVRSWHDFDWQIVGWLHKKNIPIRAPRNSFVLHFGYYGQNNSPSAMQELADGFDMSSIDGSVRPCIDWWMKAKQPNVICPQLFDSARERDEYGSDNKRKLNDDDERSYNKI